MMRDNDVLKQLTTAHLRLMAKRYLRDMHAGSRKEHKFIRERLFLHVLDEYKTRPEGSLYGAFYAFLQDLGVKPGTVRQWRKRAVSPRPPNGRKRQGNGRQGNGSSKKEDYGPLAAAIDATLEAVEAGRIELPGPANGNASLKDRVATFLGKVDQEGRPTPEFRVASLMCAGRW
jgi:hypothetical protein